MNPDQAIYAADLPAKYQSSELSIAARPIDIAPLSNGDDALTVAEEEDLSALFAPAPSSPVAPPTPTFIDEPIDLKEHMAEVERALIISALDQTDCSQRACSETPVVTADNSLKMRKYDIQRDAQSSEIRQNAVKNP